MHGWSTDNSSSALEEKVEAIKRTVLTNFIYFLGTHASYVCTIIQFCSHWPLPQDSCTHYSDLLVPTNPSTDFTRSKLHSTKPKTAYAQDKRWKDTQ